MPLGQGHVERKERESNPQGSSLDCFRDSCHRPLACPSEFISSIALRSVAFGATVLGCKLRRQELNLRGTRLTDARNYQQLPLRNRVGAVGFEPTISCFRSRRNCQAFPYADRKSAQRESNPHIRHGKAVGCRYIIGALLRIRIQLSKIKEHRAGLEPASPHYGCGILAARRPVLCCQWDRRDSNPHLPG